MHEYSIVKALLDRVAVEARAHDAASVQRLRVRIGELSGVEIDLLESAFEVFREKTLCAGAELEVISVKASWACPDCGREVPAGTILRCPDCALPARLVAGEEIFLDRIEMEVA